MTFSRFIRRALVAIAALAAVWGASPAYADENESPETEADFYRMRGTQPGLTIPAPGVLANDSDPDGDPLRARLIGPPDYGGKVKINRDGSFRFRPAPGATFDNFDYLAVDGHSVSTWGHVYITITHPPTAVDDDYGALTRVRRVVPANEGVLFNDRGVPERSRLASPPAHGEVVLRRDGRFAYTSDPGFVGTDSFDYKAIIDGEPASVATATVRVKASNSRPVAVADDLSTLEDTPLTVDAPGLLANDIDADGDPLHLQIVTEPFSSYWDFRPDGWFYFEPWYDYDSPVDFTYRISDGLEWSDPATATIEIHFVNDPPYAEEDAFGMNGADSINVSAPGVLANDYDEVESDIVFARLIRPTHKGTIDLHADGSFSYTRDPGESGRDRFMYEVYDSGGATGNRVFVYLYPGFY